MVKKIAEAMGQQCTSAKCVVTIIQTAGRPKNAKTTVRLTLAFPGNNRQGHPETKVTFCVAESSLRELPSSRSIWRSTNLRKLAAMDRLIPFPVRECQTLP